MVIVLEGIADAAVIVLLCITIILLGVAGVIGGIVNLFGHALRHLPFGAGRVGGLIADAIEAIANDVRRWLLHWFHQELHWLVGLFRGLAWTITETIDGIVDVTEVIAHGFSRVIHHYIPAAIHALRDEVQGWVQDLHHLIARVETVLTDAFHEVRHDLDALIDRVPHLITAALHEFDVAIVRPIARALHTVENEISDVLRPGLEAVRDAVRALHAEIAAGVGTIEDVLPRLPDISFDDLSDLLDRIPWRKLSGLLAFGFLTRALLRALTRETGLDRAECRGKVRGVCGTDPRAWENLLFGLVAGLAMVDFRELVTIAETVVDEVKDEFIDYAKGQF